MVTRDQLFRMPKAELHVHLDGSLRAETMLELAAELGIALPSSDAGELRAFMEARNVTDLPEYLQRFDLTLSLMQQAPALERIAYELAVDLAAENVRYAEIRFSPALNAGGGLALEEVLDASLQGLRRAEEEAGIVTGVIVCAIRTLPPSTSVALAELAVAYRERGVCGFDLAGAEKGYPAGDHVEAFRIAREGGLGITIHAGEAAGAESIRDALHNCGAHRIGHGTRLHEDGELLEELASRRIPLEVCLTSNVQTGAVPSIEAHPARRYFGAGVPVTLNTDNRLISGTTMTEEYWRAHRALGFRGEDLAQVVLDSCQAAFLPNSRKAELVRRITAELASTTESA